MTNWHATLDSQRSLGSRFESPNVRATSLPRSQAFSEVSDYQAEGSPDPPPRPPLMPQGVDDISGFGDRGHRERFHFDDPFKSETRHEYSRPPPPHPARPRPDPSELDSHSYENRLSTSDSTPPSVGTQESVPPPQFGLADVVANAAQFGDSRMDRQDHTVDFPVLSVTVDFEIRKLIVLIEAGKMLLVNIIP